ncbi:MAG: nitroreductase family protein [Candidatus Heimdallarchaeota archaeon]
MKGQRARIIRIINIFLVFVLTLSFFPLSLSEPQPFSDSALPTPKIGSVSLERALSQLTRSSEWTNESVNQKTLSQILWAAYGYSLRGTGHRTVPSAHGAYPLLLLVASSDGVYEFLPQTHELTRIHSEDLRENIRDQASGSYQNSLDGAPILLMIFAHRDQLKERIFRYADSGCVVQNVFLEATTHQIGTNFVDSDDLTEILGIDADYETIGVMPLGYPANSLPEASFRASSETLPEPRESSKSVEEAMSKRQSIRSWDDRSLNMREVAQILWSASRVVANDSIRLFLAGASRVEEYLISSHELIIHLSGDKRLDLADSFVAQTWAAKAPYILVIAFDESRDTEGKSRGSTQHLDAGLVMQNIYLSAAAWELGTVVIGGGWDPSELRNILQLPTHVVPLYIMPVGHTSLIDLYNFGALIILFAIPLFYLSSIAYLPRSRKVLRRRKAKWIHCGTAFLILLVVIVHIFFLGIYGIISGHETDWRYYFYAIYRVFIIDFWWGYPDWVLGQFLARISAIALITAAITGLSFNWLTRRRLLNHRRVRIFHQASIAIFASTMVLHAAINGSWVSDNYNLFILINLTFLAFWAFFKYLPIRSSQSPSSG